MYKISEDATMIAVSVSTFRAHAPRYLQSVRSGEVVTLTNHGKPVAELRRPATSRMAKAKQLAEIAATARIGDIENPAITNWGDLG